MTRARSRHGAAYCRAVDRTRATVFGRVANSYDRVRPRYPAAMFDDLIAATGRGAGSTVVEIGCGTGIATAALTERGYRVTAIDPDSRMLQVARRRPELGDVRFIEGRFEEVSGLGSFDLVFAGSSWHWVEAEAGLVRAAGLLRPAGSLAVCWNLPRPQRSDRPAGIDAAYRRHAPELVGRASQVRDKSQEHRKVLIADAPRFAEPEVFSYDWSRTLRSRSYCELLSTHSDHVILGPERLARLLDAIRIAVDGVGGTLELCYETVMYVARRA